MVDVDARVFDRHATPVHYWDVGEGPISVVMTHGAGGDHTSFAPQVEPLAAAGFRVITWDTPPFGASRPTTVPFTGRGARDDLIALVDHLGLELPVLFGQSLGGGICQAAVRARPDRFAGLVVLGAPWITGPLRRGERVPMRWAASALSVLPTPLIHRLLVRLVAGSSPNPQLRPQVRDMLRRATRPELLQAVRAGGELLDPDPTYRTPVPLCLIRGDRDTTFQVHRIGPRWAAAEGIREVVVPDAGHVANLDNPEVVTAALIAFLRSLPSRVDPTHSPAAEGGQADLPQ